MHISADSNSLKATETIPSGCLCSRRVEREGEASRAEEGEQGAGEINSHNSMEVFCNSEGATTTQHKVHIRVVPV